MVSRRMFVSIALLSLTFLQTGCCCHRHRVFRVQNSCCCTPAPRTACCETTSGYRRIGGGLEPIAEPPMSMPPAMIQPR